MNDLPLRGNNGKESNNLRVPPADGVCVGKPAIQRRPLLRSSPECKSHARREGVAGAKAEVRNAISFESKVNPDE